MPIAPFEPTEGSGCRIACGNGVEWHMQWIFQTEVRTEAPVALTWYDGWGTWNDSAVCTTQPAG